MRDGINWKSIPFIEEYGDITTNYIISRDGQVASLHTTKFVGGTWVTKNRKTPQILKAAGGPNGQFVNMAYQGRRKTVLIRKLVTAAFGVYIPKTTDKDVDNFIAGV